MEIDALFALWILLENTCSCIITPVSLSTKESKKDGKFTVQKWPKNPNIAYIIEIIIIKNFNPLRCRRDTPAAATFNVSINHRFEGYLNSCASSQCHIIHRGITKEPV